MNLPWHFIAIVLLSASSIFSQISINLHFDPNDYTAITTGVTAYTDDRFGKPNSAKQFVPGSYMTMVAPTVKLEDELFTINAWSKGYGRLFWSKTGDRTFASFGYSDSTLYFNYGFSTNDSAVVTIPGIKLSENFHMFTVSCEKVSTTPYKVFFYIDGVIVASKNYTKSPPKWGTTITRAPPSFIGIMDEFTLYRKTLGSAEINNLYHQGGWPLSTHTTPYKIISKEERRVNYATFDLAGRLIRKSLSTQFRTGITKQIINY